jgi:hypothetical protein
MTLHWFGNTSSSSIWYEYIEAKGRMRKGDQVWQIAFGSGFKCNSAVWQALRTIQPKSQQSPWAHCISQYPVKIPEVYKFNWTHKKLESAFHKFVTTVCWNWRDLIYPLYRKLGISLQNHNLVQ